MDNGSTDETPARLREIPWVRVVTNASNLGYVRGNNAGIAAAPPDADVVLLNNDVEIHQDGWLDALREAAHAAPDVGIVGCRLVLPDGRLLHAGTYILPDTFWGQQIGALETDVNQYARTRDVEGIVFACAYLKREVLARIGGLSERFRSYFEDTDFCLRAKEAGFRTVVLRRRDARPPRARLDGGRSRRRSRRSSRRAARRSAASGGRSSRRATGTTLSWQSILNFPTGYAMSCREILRACDAEGIRVAYAYVYGPGHALPRARGRERARLPPERRSPRGGAGGGRASRSSTGRATSSHRNRGRHRIGYTMLEVDGFPDGVGAAGERDGRGVGAVRLQPRRVPRVGPEEAGPRHAARRRRRPLPPRHPRRPQPRGRLRLPRELRMGRAQARGHDPEGLQPDLPARASPSSSSARSSTSTSRRTSRAQIEALGLSAGGGRIAFLHNREFPYHQLGALYRSADCYVSAGRGEGWDMPLMEAMACGLPVDRDGLGRAHGVRPRRDRVPAARAAASSPPTRAPRTTRASAGPTPIPSTSRTSSGTSSSTATRPRRKGRRAAAEMAAKLDVGPRGAPHRGAAGRDRVKRAAVLYVFLTLLVWGLFAFDQGLFHDDAAHLAWAQQCRLDARHRASSTPLTAPTRLLLGAPYILAWASPAPAAVLQLVLGVYWLLSGFAVVALARRLFPWSRALALVAGALAVTATSDLLTNTGTGHRILFFGPDACRRPRGGAALPGDRPARGPRRGGARPERRAPRVRRCDPRRRARPASLPRRAGPGRPPLGRDRGRLAPFPRPLRRRLRPFPEGSGLLRGGRVRRRSTRSARAVSPPRSSPTRSCRGGGRSAGPPGSSTCPPLVPVWVYVLAALAGAAAFLAATAADRRGIGSRRPRPGTPTALARRGGSRPHDRRDARRVLGRPARRGSVPHAPRDAPPHVASPRPRRGGARARLRAPRLALALPVFFVGLGVAGGVERQDTYLATWRRQRAELASILEAVPALDPRATLVLSLAPDPGGFQATRVPYLASAWMSLLWDDPSVAGRTVVSLPRWGADCRPVAAGLSCAGGPGSGLYRVARARRAPVRRRRRSGTGSSRSSRSPPARTDRGRSSVPRRFRSARASSSPGPASSGASLPGAGALTLCSPRHDRRRPVLRGRRAPS